MFGRHRSDFEMRQAVFRKTTVGPDDETSDVETGVLGFENFKVLLPEQDDRDEIKITSNPFKRGARNQLEKDIIYSIDKDCRCGSACLKSMKTSVQFIFNHYHFYIL